MKYIKPFIVFSMLCSAAQAQQLKQEKEYFNVLRSNFHEQNAFETVAFVEQRWRLAGNSGFNESIYRVEKILQDAGFVKETKGEADATLTYRIETRPMKRPTWEPVDAKVYIVGEDKPLLEFKTNRNMLATYSASTPAEGITAEVIDVGKGSAKDYEGKDVKGKIVLADGGIGSAYGTGIKNGAIGAFGYSLPAYTQPTKHVNSIQFQGIGYTDSLKQKWGILLSTAARERLKAALAKGPVNVRVIVSSKIYNSEELTIVANVRGNKLPDERFVYSAHVQEPGANDNASGVGTLAEMARVTAQLVKEGKLAPQRTITFLWGDEIVSTGRYIKDDSVRAKGIKWGLSLDMVGEDTKKTGGSFLIEKMPDPSAIWTRGNDKHTEWGGSVLKESDMFPHYFNDLLLNRCLNEAKETGWVVNTNPFEGGSDHTPFLRAKIPGLLMWHFTDVFYHTDGDRIDMVSAEEMRHVGISALVTAYLLTNTDDKIIAGLIDDITANALQRLQTEAGLSKKAVTENTSTKDKEQHLLEVWRDWYVKAIATTSDMSNGTPSAKVQKAIAAADKKIKDATAKHIAAL
ncbi:MAG: M28 family peptidase [Chitinophagaceae bacterium]